MPNFVTQQKSWLQTFQGQLKNQGNIHQAIIRSFIGCERVACVLLCLVLKCSHSHSSVTCERGACVFLCLAFNVLVLIHQWNSYCKVFLCTCYSKTYQLENRTMISSAALIRIAKITKMSSYITEWCCLLSFTILTPPNSAM